MLLRLNCRFLCRFIRGRFSLSTAIATLGQHGHMVEYHSAGIATLLDVVVATAAIIVVVVGNI